MLKLRHSADLFLHLKEGVYAETSSLTGFVTEENGRLAPPVHPFAIEKCTPWVYVYNASAIAALCSSHSCVPKMNSKSYRRTRLLVRLGASGLDRG